MATPSGLVLADDATGALECASLLATLHLDVTLSLNAPPTSASGILVVDTESRHLAADDAATRLRSWTAPLIFKKTDSTLRGNIAAELLELARLRPVVYLPAYPALGRTVREGRLLVNGIPVHETEFAHDPRHPVRSSTVADLFPAGVTINVRHPDELKLAAGRILICDAATDEDLARFALALRNLPVTVAGPAGFIPPWASLSRFPSRPPAPLPPVSQWLIVCGSRHPQSRRQADVAAGLGFPVLRSDDAPSPSPENVARDLARRAAEAIAHTRPQGVLLMGGDTAWALWQALGIRTLQPLPELLPGIAACRAPDHGLLFVTKAGGFGDDTLVRTIADKLA